MGLCNTYNQYHCRPVNFISVIPVQAGIQKVVETTGFRPAPEYPMRFAGQALTGEVADYSCLNPKNYTVGHAKQRMITNASIC